MATWRSHTEDKKARDREQLDRIYKDYKTRDLTKEELRFLYEIDEEIIGYGKQMVMDAFMFGYDKDPRIEEIISSRNIKQDLARVFDCQENQISLSREEALQGNILYHHGDLDLSDLTSLNGVALPKIIGRDLNLEGATSVDTPLPKIVGRDLRLSSLTAAENIPFPEEVGRVLRVDKLTITDLIHSRLPNEFTLIWLSNGCFNYEALQEELQQKKLQQEKSLLISGSEESIKRTRNMNG